MAFASMIVKQVGQTIKGLVDGWNYVLSQEVLVGIPEENNSARGQTITNAELMYIMENGSPVNHIPPRPVIHQALQKEENRDPIKKMLKEGTRNGLLGRKEAAEKCWEKAGMLAESAVKKEFVNGGFAPNAPITVHGGWMKNHVSGKVFYVQGKGSSKPLIDTGSLMNSIKHEVRKKK